MMDIDVEKLEAGYELNKLVADKVMDSVCRCEKGPTGWSIHGYGSAHGICHRCNRPHEAPNYSGDIAAAWLIVELMTARMGYNEPDFLWHGPLSKPENKYLTNEGYPLGTTCWYVNLECDGMRYTVCADTPALAICRAALLTSTQTRED